MASSHYDGPIPHLDAIRRVPTRYQQILPLKWVKQHQCIVVGAARGVFTVAITDSQRQPSIYLLERITGRRIFVVLVKPDRMRLLIKRLERYQHCSQSRRFSPTCYAHRLQLRAYIQFLLAR